MNRAEERTKDIMKDRTETGLEDYYLLSVDPGIRNTGASLFLVTALSCASTSALDSGAITEPKYHNKFVLCDVFLLGADVEDTPENRAQNLIQRQMTYQVCKLKADVMKIIGDKKLVVVIEQQPQINFLSCAVHTIFSCVFAKYQQVSQHPCRKLEVNELDTKIDGKALSLKAFTKALATVIINNTQSERLLKKWKSFKKKDDVADSIAHALYFIPRGEMYHLR